MVKASDSIFKIIILIKMTLFLFFILVSNTLLYSKSNDDKILERKPEYTPTQRILGDTLQQDRTSDTKTALPGGAVENYTPEQDSAYFNAIKLNIPVSSRIGLSLDLHSRRIMEKMIAEQSGGIYTAQRNLSAIPPELFIPSAREQVLYDYNIQMAQTVPFISNPSNLGLRVPLSAIGAFLGLTEDVSPVINYKLDYAVDVEIVIYSLNAAVVAVLFEGVQPASVYTITWNGKDDKGRKVTSGDYIAEVRIGKQKFIRKRILIP